MKITYCTIDDEEFEVKLCKKELNILCDKLPEFSKVVKELRSLVKDCRAWHKEVGRHGE